VQATSQGATASDELPTGDRLKRWWTLASLTKEGMASTRWGRFARWLSVGVAVLYGVRLLGDEGPSALRHGLAALMWPVLATFPALFGLARASQRALEQLARLHGLNGRESSSARVLARITLVATPLMWSTLAIWLCFAVNLDSLRGALLALVGLSTTLLVQLGLAGVVSATTAVCEQLSPTRPQRTLWLLVLVPAVLRPVVPELPSVWDAYEHWVTWSVTLGTDTVGTES
jgi:hypothetical protein